MGAWSVVSSDGFVVQLGRDYEPLYSISLNYYRHGVQEQDDGRGWFGEWEVGYRIGGRTCCHRRVSLRRAYWDDSRSSQEW